MKPAERIPLLKKLATALSDEDTPWKETALVLRQFGFTTVDDRGWDDHGFETGPSLYEVVLGNLENSGDDESRLELERYLDPSDTEQSAPTRVGPGPWKGDSTFRLFISHTHPNAPFAAEMKKYLGHYLIECFVAHNDIEPSEKWMRVIESALLTSHAAVALVTPDFRASQWCDQEIGFCLARSMLVVPLMRGVDPHGFLGEFQGVKISENTHPATAAVQVFKILATRPETGDRMVPSVVRRYSASKSFDNTREAFTLLTQIPKDAWTPDLVREVTHAGIDNSQVKAANLRSGTPAPEAAEKLLAPIRRWLGVENELILF